MKVLFPDSYILCPSGNVWDGDQHVFVRPHHVRVCLVVDHPFDGPRPADGRAGKRQLQQQRRQPGGTGGVSFNRSSRMCVKHERTAEENFHLFGPQVWTIGVMLLSRKFTRLPHIFALNLFLAQVSACLPA